MIILFLMEVKMWKSFLQKCIYLALYTTCVSTLTLPWGPYYVSRAGRGNPSSTWYDKCCPVGLKTETVPAYGGWRRDQVYEHCMNECCEDLEQVAYQGEEGVLYVYCIENNYGLNEYLDSEIKQLTEDKLNRMGLLLKSIR